MAPITKPKIIKILSDYGAPATIEDLSEFVSRRPGRKRVSLIEDLQAALEKGIKKKYLKKYNNHYFNINDTEKLFEEISSNSDNNLEVPSQAEEQQTSMQQYEPPFGMDAVKDKMCAICGKPKDPLKMHLRDL
ncbi:uncharacterized protein LOC119684361 [Teleopsis dalmanni]|uniref:uncharacterized protein LOC119684361 n=1 Tax=Teleopsis dalmanni TaxID=139649 RepID=UPI0018CCE753|nr:uncharacterized protein LOC119684361 [Teleopsis dalmanni]